MVNLECLCSLSVTLLTFVSILYVSCGKYVWHFQYFTVTDS